MRAATAIKGTTTAIRLAAILALGVVVVKAHNVVRFTVTVMDKSLNSNLFSSALSV